MTRLFRWIGTVFLLLLSSGLMLNAQTPARAKRGSVSSQIKSLPIVRTLSANALPPTTYNVTGDWTDTYGYQWLVSASDSGSITGLVQVDCGSYPWVITGNFSGPSFTLHAANPDSSSDGPNGPCSAYFDYSMTFTSTTTAYGPWTNSVGYSGTVTMTQTTTCASVINNAMSAPVLGDSKILSGYTNISATFTPSLNGTPYGLQQAAQLCGFTNFDWIQIITKLPDPSPFYEVNPGDASNPIHLTSASAPYNDPPQYGYTYNPAWVSYPFYWDPNTTGSGWSLSRYETDNSLRSYDSPADPCISGPLGLPSSVYIFNSDVRAQCGNTTTARGAQIYFTTHLAGINPDGSAVDLGIGYTWTSNFNGTFGGIATTASYGPVDPGSGVGGITITSVNNTTNYEYLGTPVKQAVLLSGNQIAITASGLAYSRVSQTFNGTVTITNRGTSVLTGPFQILLSSLSAGATVVNSTQSFGGFPVLVVPGVSSLAPGKSATVSVQFKNSSNASITFIPLSYSGSLNQL